MGRLGAPVSDDTILRHLKRRVADRNATTPVRVAGIDDWSWRKGSTYGAIVVDLERREVVDVLPDRSAAATANWLRGRPEVEVVSRDRCGLFAQGAREGAPQARQVAGRFHLLQNFRQAIERQLSRAGRSTGRPLVAAASSEDENGASCFCSPSGQRQVAEHKHLVRHAHRRSRQEILRSNPRPSQRRDDFSARLPREQGFIGAASPNGSNCPRRRSEPRSRQSRALQTIFWTICGVVGRRGASWADICSTKSNAEATSAASPTWSDCWRSGDASPPTRRQPPSCLRSKPSIRRPVG